MKKGGLSTGDIAALYKYKNVTFDVKVDTESNVGCFAFSAIFILHLFSLDLVHVTHPLCFHLTHSFVFARYLLSSL